MIKAIQRFDPERGRPFAASAMPTILGELRRYRRDTTESGYERVESLAAAIEKAVPALSGEQRAVLRLHFDADLTTRQIAGRLGMSRSHASRTLAGAVSSLRSAVREASLA